jgi:hypothetical protein
MADDDGRSDAGPDDGGGPDNMGRDDVEKRWHDPEMYRHAAGYCVGVLVVAALVFAVVDEWAARREPCRLAAHAFCDITSRLAILLGPGLILVAGTVGAFIATYRAWQRHRAWPIWQGAGWFLMTLSLGYLAIGSGTIMS